MEILFQGPVTPEHDAQIRDAFEKFNEAISAGKIDPLNIPETVTVLTDFDTAKNYYSDYGAVKPNEKTRDAFDQNGRPNQNYFGWRIGIDNKNPVIFINITNPAFYGVDYQFAQGDTIYVTQYTA